METNFTESEIKFGLKPRFIIGMGIIVLCITLMAILIGARTYWNSITNHYNTVAYQTAEAASGYFTAEELRSYAELVTKYHHGEISQEAIEEISQSERYQEIWTLTDKLRRSMNANDIRPLAKIKWM